MSKLTENKKKDKNTVEFVTSSITIGEFCTESDPLYPFNTKLLFYLSVDASLDCLYKQYISSSRLSLLPLSLHCFYIAYRRFHDVLKLNFRSYCYFSLSPCYRASQVAYHPTFPACLYVFQLFNTVLFNIYLHWYLYQLRVWFSILRIFPRNSFWIVRMNHLRSTQIFQISVWGVRIFKILSYLTACLPHSHGLQPNFTNGALANEPLCYNH